MKEIVKSFTIHRKKTKKRIVEVKEGKEEKDEVEKEYIPKSESVLKLLLEAFLTLKNLMLGMFCFCGPCN